MYLWRRWVLYVGTTYCGFLFFPDAGWIPNVQKQFRFDIFNPLSFNKKESISKLGVNSHGFTICPPETFGFKKVHLVALVPVWQVPGLVDTAIQVRVGMGFFIAWNIYRLNRISLDIASSWKTRGFFMGLLPDFVPWTCLLVFQQKQFQNILVSTKKNPEGCLEYQRVDILATILSETPSRQTHETNVSVIYQMQCGWILLQLYFRNLTYLANMMVSNRHLPFQGSPIFRCQPR